MQAVKIYQLKYIKIAFVELIFENEIEVLTPHSQSVFGINQCIVKSIMILVLS